MIQIINPGNLMTYPVDPRFSFSPGQIGKIEWDVYSNNNLVTLSNGHGPFVVFDDHSSMLTSGTANVWMGDNMLVFETDVFDTRGSYKVGCNLQVNDAGLLTTEYLGSRSSVGMVGGFMGGFLLVRWNTDIGMPTVKKSKGVVCKKCNTINEYAEPNQPDGSFKCWGCRN